VSDGSGLCPEELGPTVEREPSGVGRGGVVALMEREWKGSRVEAA